MAHVFKRVLPTLNRVLVKMIKPVAKTTGGLILTAQPQTFKYGKVIATGPGVNCHHGETTELTVSVGDMVWLPEFGGTKIKLDHGSFYLFRDADILGLLEQ